jgi:uncharacterized membrane protein HdeD (DUF308 family)
MATATPQSHGWALLLVWGVAWVVLGLFLLFQPGVTAILLVQIMAVFWVVGGVIDLVTGLTHGEHPHRGWHIFGGILSIAAGVIIMAHPLVGAIVTIAFGFFLLAITAIVNGLINLVGGFKGGISWGGSLLGLVQVIIGIFLVTHPMMGMLAYVPTLGIITIAAGIAVIVFAFRVKAGAAVVATA